MEIARSALPTVHSAIFEQARRTPAACALESSGQRQTYAQLSERAHDVARALAAIGAGPECVVAICIERCIELGAALLGVLESGAAYLPIDPSTPPARLRELVRDSHAMALVSVSRMAAHCSHSGVPVIAVDALPAARSTPRAAAAENLAYVLYTSGSTGKPKGVLVEHRSLAAHALGMAEHYALKPADRVLQFASLAFDVAAEELFPTWCAGACVCLRDEASMHSLEKLSAFLEEQRISVLNLPAGLWMEWTRALVGGSAKLPTHLRLVVAGSERVAPASLAQWKNLVGESVRWINGYGPTETTITATTFEPAPGIENRRGLIDIMCHKVDVIHQDDTAVDLGQAARC
jgi:non-ribosomal peptide synthetase component F